MHPFLVAGTALGAACGIFHAVSIWRQRRRDGADEASAAWFAAWTLALWTLFGAYLLAFWVIGLAGMAIARVARRAA